MRVPEFVAFTDGAAKGNPGPGGWGAVVARPEDWVVELGGADRPTTNNRMELRGPIAVLERLAATPGKVAVYTDSTYVIRGIRDWIASWKRRGWKTATGGDVLNRGAWEELSALVEARGRGMVEWHYVRGHSGIPGNERVDEIASTFATGRRPDLYDGPFHAYPVQLLDLPHDTSVPTRSSPSRPGAAPKSRGTGPAFYLSVVDGQPMRHATWTECERRVKGRSGARYRKVTSEEEMAELLRGWGFGPRSG